jgi:RNA-directed DNA polymerase
VVRYADDFIITGPDKSLLKGQIMETTEKFLEGRGLKLKDKKKNVLSIYDGFAFLGFQIKRYQWDPRKNQPKIKLTTGEPKQRTVLIIKPDKVKTQDFKSRIKKMINPNKPMESLIKDLNPLLRGWSEYYRISYHGQEIFWKLGNWIYSKMMQWAKKKHSERNTTWIVNKYVFIKDGIKWNFGINEKETIFNLSTVTNLKLVPLKEGLNPYLSENQVYFEKRQTARIQAKFRAAEKRQQTLHGDEPVELHHIIPEKDGGKWSLQNIIPLHQLCHQNITHGNLNNKKKNLKTSNINKVFG